MNEDITTGTIYRIANLISNYFIANILWIAFNIPVILIIMLTLAGDSIQATILLLIILAILSPTLLFPASTALFSVIRKWVLKEFNVPIWRTFWENYKQNYFKSMISGIILTIIWGILLVDFYYFVLVFNKQLIILFVPLIVIVFIFTLNLFSSLVHFDAGLSVLFKNTIFFTITQPFKTIGTAGLSIVIIYISFKFTFLLLFFTGSVVAYIAFKNFNKIYLKFKETQEQDAEQNDSHIQK